MGEPAALLLTQIALYNWLLCLRNRLTYLVICAKTS